MRRSWLSPHRSTGSRRWTPCRWQSCRPSRWFTTTRAMGMLWLDQFAAKRGVVLPQPTLRTGSPRTAAQLAAADMGVAIVPFSALTPRPDGTIKSHDPPELRDVIVIVAAPHDDLLRRFVSDLRRRGLPASRISALSQLGPLPGPTRATVMPGDAYPVATNTGRAP